MPKRLLPLLALAVLFVGLRTAAAQPAPQRLTAAAQSLQRYLFTSGDVPGGFRIARTPVELSNEAAAASDPDQAALIRKWGRLTQLSQTLERQRPLAEIDVSITLMKDADGAWGDALDSTFLPGVDVERTLPGPSVGERSVLFRYVVGAPPNEVEVHTLVFQRDRLEVGVTLLTLAGEGSSADLLPIAEKVDAKVVASPPAPVTEAELALIEEPTPSVLVRGAVRIMLREFIRPLQASQLLAEAWQGATEALTRAGVTGVPRPPAYPQEAEAAIALHMREFPALERLAEGKLTPQQLAYAAINEIVEQRDDCHTAHITPEQWQREKALDAGEAVVLIGVSFAPTAPLRIVATTPNSPARAAGLRPGQVVLAINGTNVENMSVTQARELIDRREGAPNVFTVRNPSGRVEDITAAPARFVIPSLESEVIGDIGVIRFTNFEPGTVQGNAQVQRLRAALEDFESRGIKGWIIDQRGNSGGDGATMTQMASLFVERGRLFGRIERGRPTVWTEATGNVLPFQRPLVFLVGPASYSAAEILPGALQARGRAILVGERTGGCIGGTRRGNGLLDGSVLNVTRTEIVIGPDGLEYHRIGVPPNVEVPELTAEDYEAGRDPQLAEALRILGELTGPNPPAIPVPQEDAPRLGVAVTV